MASPDSAVRRKDDVVSCANEITRLFENLTPYEKSCVVDGVFARQPKAAKLNQMTSKIHDMMHEKSFYRGWREEWTDTKLYALAQEIGFGFLLDKDDNKMVVDEALARFIYREGLYLADDDGDDCADDCAAQPSSSSDPPPPRRKEDVQAKPAEPAKPAKQQRPYGDRFSTRYANGKK